jgi:hypothetical protein
VRNVRYFREQIRVYAQNGALHGDHVFRFCGIQVRAFTTECGPAEHRMLLSLLSRPKFPVDNGVSV